MASCIIILAAGSSSRLGRPKQNIKVGGVSLLDRTIAVCKESDYDHILIVLGDKAASLSGKLLSKNVDFIINEGWKEGMGSSIRIGVESAIQQYDLDQIAISVIDQPHLNSSVLNDLLKSSKNSGEITASRYANGRLGVPASFPKKWFDELLQFSGDTGAREIFNSPDNNVGAVDFSMGIIDIDTEEDLEIL